MRILTFSALALLAALAIPAAPVLAHGVSLASSAVHGSASPNSESTDRGTRGVTAGGAPNGI